MRIKAAQPLPSDFSGSDSKRQSASNERRLIKVKFVTIRMLVLIFTISIAFLIFHIGAIGDYPFYVIALIEIPLFLVVWHKAYQTVYDLKLLFCFNDKYDDQSYLPKEKVLPPMAFIIPSYQEPFAVAKMTFDSVVNTPYAGRKEIIVVDNSRDTESDDFKKWKAYVDNFNQLFRDSNVNASFYYNTEQGKLKPGNLDLAQRQIREGELVVFLDVDSTLPASGDLLQRAVAEFAADEKLAFIQFRIRATNDNFNLLTHSIAVSQDLLRLRMISRGYGGYKIFEGHNGVWRRTVLDELGSWTEYYRNDIIITEDILKSAQAYARGYYGKPLNIETGEWVPSSLSAFESMWMRWMYGNSQVFFKNFREIYSSRTSLLEKFDISYHILHHLVTLCFFGITFFLQLFCPGGAANVFIFVVGIIPQLLAAVVTYSTTTRADATFGSKCLFAYYGFFLIDTFVMYTQIKSDVKFILRIRQGWRVTEKAVEPRIPWLHLIRNTSFHLVFAAICIGVCIVSWSDNYGMTADSLIYHAALLFTSFNLILSIAIFGTKRRKSHNKVESNIVSVTLKPE